MELLKSIPGEIFLVLYIVYSVCIVLLAVLIYRNDGSRGLPLPSEKEINPLAIAYLRGGALAVLRTEVFRMWKENIIDFEPKMRKKPIIGLTEIRCLKAEREMDNILDEKILMSLSGSDLKKSLAGHAPKEILDEIELLMEPHKEMLIRRGLLRKHNQTHTPLWLTLAVSVFILVPGISKFVLGIMNDKPVMILSLILLIIIAVTVAWSFKASKIRPVTRLGQEFLMRLANNHISDLNRVKAGMMPDNDAVLLAAIFGVAILGTAYSPLTPVFAREQLGGGCTLVSSVGCSTNACAGGCSAGSCSGGCSSGGGCSGCGGCGGCG